jgi:hypothetical protein
MSQAQDPSGVRLLRARFRRGIRSRTLAVLCGERTRLDGVGQGSRSERGPLAARAVQKGGLPRSIVNPDILVGTHVHQP